MTLCVSGVLVMSVMCSRSDMLCVLAVTLCTLCVLCLCVVVVCVLFFVDNNTPKNETVKNAAIPVLIHLSSFTHLSSFLTHNTHFSNTTHTHQQHKKDTDACEQQQ
jgi:hypothetical protein